MEARVRWMIRADMPEVLEIEQLCFAHAWTLDEFVRVLKQRNCIGIVCEYDGEIVGFMVYELFTARLALLNFAIHPSCQRRGFGTLMMDRLKTKLGGAQKRNRVTLLVSERNTDGLYFLRAMGWRAEGLIPEAYEHCDDDGILMGYRIGAAVDAVCEGR